MAKRKKIEAGEDTVVAGVEIHDDTEVEELEPGIGLPIDQPTTQPATLGTPFVSFFDMVKSDTDQATCNQGLQLLAQLIESLDANTLALRDDKVKGVRECCDTLDVKANVYVKGVIEQVAQTSFSIEQQVSHYVRGFLSQVSNTLAELEEKVTTCNKSCPETTGDTKPPEPKPEPKPTGPKPTEVVCVPVVDYFPLVADLVPAQTEWKGKWKICRDKFWCHFIIMPTSLACPNEYVHETDRFSIDYGKLDYAIQDLDAWYENVLKGNYTKPRGFDPGCFKKTVRDFNPVKGGGGLILGISAIDWSVIEACELAKQSIDFIAQYGVNTTAKALGLVDGDGNASVPKWIADIINQIPLLPNWTAKIFAGIIRVVVDTIDAFTEGLATKLPCDVRKLAPQYAALLINGLIDKYFGFKVPKLEQNIRYQIDMTCPEMLPTSSEVDAMYLGNEIDRKKWDCLVSANNDIPQQRFPLINAARQKPSVTEYIGYWARGLLDDKGLSDKLRGIGWLYDKDVEVIKEMAWSTPSVSDLIVFMLRDVFDASVVSRFGYMDEFPAKFNAEAKKLADATGARQRVMELNWMAHWKNPSNTQLFTMYHRLRGGKGQSGISRWFDKDGNPLKSPVPLTKDDIAVTEGDVARAIGINDVLPFWRDRLLAISRPVLTRVDVRRAYDIDAIGESEVYESYRDLGYDDANAKTLTKFATELKKRGDVRRKGFMLPSRISNLYKRGGLNRAEANDLLIQSGLRPPDAKANLDQADIEIKALSRMECLKSIEKRFMFGDISGDKVVTLVMDQGIDMPTALSMRKRMECRLANKSKEVTASILCKWWEKGLIDDGNYLKRLQMIGYRKEDAEKIVKTCQLAKQEKQSKQDVKDQQPLEPQTVPRAKPRKK